MTPKKGTSSQKPSKTGKTVPSKDTVKPRIVKKRDGNYPVKLY